MSLIIWAFLAGLVIFFVAFNLGVAAQKMDERDDWHTQGSDHHAR